MTLPAHARPRLVAIDFDGTLLRSDLTVSERSARAVRAAVDAGIRVMVVTGRPPRWLAPIAELFERRGTAIAANGALVIDLASSRVLDSRHLDRAASAAVIERLRALFPDARFGVEHPDGFAHERGYPRGIRQSEQVPGVAYADTIEELLADPPVKILARVPSVGIDEAARAAKDALDGVAAVYYSSTDLLEIAPAGVSKASTLERIATRWDIAAEHVVAIGDMPNDVPMLRWAGRGVAVANAHPQVRAVADEVTASNDDDGVALVLEDLLD
ncbi:MAG TPA: Cof-type HAD-IIB family hydrolase [Euzebyales bacterium]|nr:Cof-type HAD-IIB family hydrolase [Euzebyales bacterium]